MIFKEEFYTNCKNLCTYFEKIFEQDTSRLAHSIILYGLNSELNYEFAIELARLLNCQENKSADCQCLSCKWARANKHPSIKTYSNLESKAKSDESKLTITMAQISQLRDELLTSTDDKRVYILCAAENGEDKDTYTHLPLNSKILAQEPSNALLKSIEEPPKNTYFIFLTKDKNDLLPTIISRSQAFYIHSLMPELEKIDGLENVFKYYPYNDFVSTNDFLKRLQNWQNEHNLSLEKTLDYAQNYLETLLKANINNVYLTNKITKNICDFEDGKKKLRFKFNDQPVWENLLYTIYKD